MANEKFLQAKKKLDDAIADIVATHIASKVIVQGQGGGGGGPDCGLCGDEEFWRSEFGQLWQYARCSTCGPGNWDCPGNWCNEF